jgi:hypothetical protein
MNQVLRLLLGCLCCLWLSASLVAAPQPLRLKWDQLTPIIDGQPVIVELKDGSSVKGVARSFAADEMALNVTSNSHRTYKKGPASIPRSEIASLRLAEGSEGNHARLGMIVGGAVGIGGGVALILAGAGPQNCGFLGCGYPSRNTGMIGAGVGVMFGAPLAGYFIGRHFDHQGTPITLLPD